MGIQICWDDETKTALLQYYRGTWSMADYEQMIAETRAAIHSVDHTMYLVGIIEGSFDMPDGFFMRFATLGQNIPANFGGIIVVGDDNNLRMVHSVFSKVAHPLTRYVHFVGTLEDARKLIADASAARSD